MKGHLCLLPKKLNAVVLVLVHPAEKNTARAEIKQTVSKILGDDFWKFFGSRQFAVIWYAFVLQG